MFVDFRFIKSFRVSNYTKSIKKTDIKLINVFVFQKPSNTKKILFQFFCSVLTFKTKSTLLYN